MDCIPHGDEFLDLTKGNMSSWVDNPSGFRP